MYKVESWASWFVVDTTNKKAAYRAGVKEYGRHGVKSVTKATEGQIDYFIGVKGKDAVTPSY